MAFSLPHTSLPQWPVMSPERFAAQIELEDPDGCKLAILGLPDDTGIRLNNGRPGAAQGPQAFRNALASFGNAFDGRNGKPIWPTIYDAGDIIPAAGNDETALLETHTRIEAAARLLHQNNLIPICIGGGHDLTLPTVSALAKHLGKPVGGINLDAHLDVRPAIGSGMAYRHLVETQLLDPSRFVELGVGRFANAEAFIQWARDHRVQITFNDEVSDCAVQDSFSNALSSAGFVSIDLDCIDASQAPGVSALNPSGLSVATAAIVAEAAGTNQNVRHFDLMELSPQHDQQHRTARVAALLFLHFVAGFGARSS